MSAAPAAHIHGSVTHRGFLVRPSRAAAPPGARGVVRQAKPEVREREHAQGNADPKEAIRERSEPCSPIKRVLFSTGVHTLESSPSTVQAEGIQQLRQLPPL